MHSHHENYVNCQQDLVQTKESRTVIATDRHSTLHRRVSVLSTLQYFDAAKALAPSGLEARLFEVACLLAMGGATGLDNDKGRSSLAKGMDLLKVLGKVADVVEAHSARALLGFAMSCGESLLRRGLSTQADRFLTSALGLSNGDADAQ